MNSVLAAPGRISDLLSSVPGPNAGRYAGMPDVEGAIARLCTAGTDVSAHYIVLEDGRIVQCVPEASRLARRRVVLGGRGSIQFLLDWNRDRQSRP